MGQQWGGVDGQVAEFDGIGRDGVLIVEEITQLLHSFYPDIWEDVTQKRHCEGASHWETKHGWANILSVHREQSRCSLESLLKELSETACHSLVGDPDCIWETQGSSSLQSGSLARPSLLGPSSYMTCQVLLWQESLRNSICEFSGGSV